MHNIQKEANSTMVGLDEADFISVTEDDIPLIQKYLDIAQIEESNHNLVNMFLWREQYPLWQYHTDNYMLLLGIHKGKLFCYMPLCEKRYFEEAIFKAEAIFKKYNVPFELSCFTKDGLELLENILPKCKVAIECEAADYVYEGEKMRTLSGKKLQKRRNNYNHFVSEYKNRFIYEDLTKEHIPEIKAFLDSWRNDSNEEYLIYEAKGVRDVLDLFGILPYSGGVIRIDGEVKAFLIASLATKNMVQINIEKADPSIRGLYQAIEKTFLEKNYPEIEWVNREDDMGIESLIMAKKALHPSHMIDKYRIKANGKT
jgi:uncharacterized protein